MASEAVVLRDDRGAQVLRMDLAGRGRFALVHRADLIARTSSLARIYNMLLDVGKNREIATRSVHGQRFVAIGRLKASEW